MIGDITVTQAPQKLIPASSPVLTDADWSALRTAGDAHWLTEGADTVAFQNALAGRFNASSAYFVNSGSSANLLAVASMVECGYWTPGDEILTPACAFPTTVNPLLLYGLVPVFVDVDPLTLNMSVASLRGAVNARTRGIVAAHTLGNPFDLDEVARLKAAFRLHVIEDCCDALGATWRGVHVGGVGDAATCSFFPAHHITTGEGGAAMTSNPRLAAMMASVRDWGRDCYCVPGREGTCGRRFSQCHGTLPYGYDHKYTYSALGFNLKATELQAALGVSQIARLDEFVAARRRNHAWLAERLAGCDGIEIVQATPGSEPSWFGFPFLVREAGVRQQLQSYLKQQGVDSRLVFAGNITRQPYVMKRRGAWKAADALTGCDRVMNDAMWVGVWPGLGERELEAIAAAIAGFFGEGI